MKDTPEQIVRDLAKEFKEGYAPHFNNAYWIAKRAENLVKTGMPEQIEWLPIDPNNLPEGKVVIDTGNEGIQTGVLIKSEYGSIMYETEYSLYFDVTHYIPIEQLKTLPKKANQ